MRRPTRREKRLLVYLAIVLVIVGWDVGRRRWSPAITVTTAHYTIQSSATAEQTREIGVAAELLHAGYMTFLDELDVTPQSHGKLQLKLFKDREEFRLCNRVRGWAEAFYRKPYCYQYYSAGEPNPYHWMIHEGTHQLTAEVAGLDLPKWLDEGIADYFGTSQIVGAELALGQIDTNTYPVWWLHKLATTEDLAADKGNTSVIPLRSIISGTGGPDIDEFFNLYYLHWWSLAHFLMEYEDGKYRHGVAQMVESDGDESAFERHIGNIEDIEKQWYAHVLGLKRELTGLRTPPVTLTQVNGQSEDPGQ